MSPRTGRPKKDDAIVGRLSIRIGAEMLSQLEAYCKQESVTKGEAIRRALVLLFGMKN